MIENPLKGKKGKVIDKKRKSKMKEKLPNSPQEVDRPASKKRNTGQENANEKE